MTLCFKAFSQQQMKSMVAPIKTSASAVESDGSGQPPPLLPSSQYDWCYFSCVSIEHMILYLSVLAFIINPLNTFPCNFLQIDVFQLPITYQHGVTLYSIKNMWLYLGKWYSNYPHLSLFLSRNYYTLWAGPILGETRIGNCAHFSRSHF